MRGIADSSTTKLRSLPPSSCINCLCATTTAAETTTDDFVGSPMPSEFPDTLKRSLGPRKDVGGTFRVARVELLPLFPSRRLCRRFRNDNGAVGLGKGDPATDATVARCRSPRALTIRRQLAVLSEDSRRATPARALRYAPAPTRGA